MRRIGIAQWCLDRGGPRAVYRAANLGLSALHIDVGELCDPVLRRSYLTAVRDTGVAITAIAINILNDCEPGFGIGPTSQKKWTAVRTAIETANFLTVPIVALPSFDRAEILTEQHLACVAEALRTVCEYAALAHIVIATENSLGLADNLRLMHMVSRPNLRVLIDSLNPVLWGHNTSSLIHGLWPFLCDQVHAKDGRDGMMGNCLLGEGQAQFAETADTLCRMGFAGDLILENDYGQDTEQRVMADIATINRLLGETEQPDPAR